MSLTGNLSVADLNTGDRFALGSLALTREAIVDFASRYDPHPYHLEDSAAAANPVFGRLAASGWHTAAIANLLVTRFLMSTRIIGIAGIGIDELRWLKPVFVDDVMCGELEFTGIRPSASRPDRVVVKMRTVLRNQNCLDVLSLVTQGIFALEPKSLSLEPGSGKQE
jgi:acyl dehydratase